MTSHLGGSDSAHCAFRFVAEEEGLNVKFVRRVACQAVRTARMRAFVQRPLFYIFLTALQ